MTDKPDENPAALYESARKKAYDSLPPAFRFDGPTTIRRQADVQVSTSPHEMSTDVTDKAPVESVDHAVAKVIVSFIQMASATEVLARQVKISAPPSGWLLDVVLDPGKAEDVRYNLEDARELWVARYGIRKANRLFNWQCVRVVVGHVVNRLLKYAGRFKKIIGN